MQLKKDARKEISTQSSRFVHQIGSTVYTVNLFGKEDSKEKPEDKMLRLLMRELENLSRNRVYKGSENNMNTNAVNTYAENLALQAAPGYVMMTMPQADWLPERGTV